MMHHVYLLFLLGLLSCMQVSGLAQARLVVSIPTAEEEAVYLWQTLQDLPFFEAHNYTLSLPPGGAFDTLRAKALRQGLTDQDSLRLVQLVQDSIYHREDYQAGATNIVAQLPLLESLVEQLDSVTTDWTFKSFETYTVNLTLYGPGGSFNPDDGSLLLFTTTTGKFKSYDNPANTIIHEIVHIGIETAIIARYQVHHPLKERIVDRIVSLLFQNDLPDYRIQDMGDYRIDPYLLTREDLQRLDQSVQALLNTD